MGTSSTSTQKSEPSDFIKPYLGEAMGGARAQYQAGAPKYYEGNTVPKELLNQISSYGTTSQANRASQMAGSNYAMNQFAGGNLGDWGTVDQMRGLGAQNNYAQDQGAANIMQRMGSGTDLAKNLVTRTGDIITSGGNVGGYSQDAIGDLSRSGGNVGGYSQDAIGDLSRSGGNVGGYSQDAIGDLSRSGGNVGGYSRNVIGDITQSGAGSNSQIRSDIRDLITGQAQGLNPSMVPLMDTAGGGYLNANPYLDSAFSKAADNVTRAYRTGTAPAIDSAFSRSSGALRSGAAINARDQAQENLGKTLGNLATDIYGGNYAQERQNQLSAANSLGSQYLQGLGLRASTAASSADQANRDAQLRLAATGQVSNDMSGDLARRLQATSQISSDMSGDAMRRMQATGQISSDMSGDAMRRMQATGQISSDMSGDLARRMQASNAMTQAEQGDINNFMAANDRLSQAYNRGADRQLQSLGMANNAYNASRAQQLQALGMQPGYLQQQQQMDYNDFNAALEAQQQNINADIARWDYEQNKDRNNVNWYLNAVNGVPGMTNSSVTQRGGMSGLGSGLSGASSAAMLMKMLGLF